MREQIFALYRIDPGCGHNSPWHNGAWLIIVNCLIWP